MVGMIPNCRYCHGCGRGRNLDASRSEGESSKGSTSAHPCKRARQCERAKRLVFGHFFLGRALGCSPFMIDRISLKSYPFFESS